MLFLTHDYNRTNTPYDSAFGVDLQSMSFIRKMKGSSISNISKIGKDSIILPQSGETAKQSVTIKV